MPADNQFDEFSEDLIAERAPRPIIIIGASKVDDLLFQILNEYFLPKIAKQREQDELLEGDRPLATFSSRIKLTCRLGLIDNTLYAALEKLRNLRNQSAHSIEFNISKSPLREHFRDLHKNIVQRKSFDLTKRRYFNSEMSNNIEELQCIILTLCVLLEAILRKTSQTKKKRILLRIAAE